jgi:hypothetical protein
LSKIIAGLIKIHPYLDPPPSRGRKVGKDSLNRDYFVALLLAMTFTGEPALVKTGDACLIFYFKFL